MRVEREVQPVASEARGLTAAAEAREVAEARREMSEICIFTVLEQ